MLIVAGTIEVEADKREEFLRSREEAMRISRSEPGCLDYVFSADPLEPRVVRLFERWESKEALAAHLQALRARQSSAPREPGTAPKMDVAQYEIAAMGQVGS